MHGEVSIQQLEYLLALARERHSAALRRHATSASRRCQ